MSYHQPVKGKYLFTFNRDELVGRKALLEFQQKRLAGKSCYFLLDEPSMGTWFAVTETGTVVMLFNGAYGAHKKNKTGYKASRGSIIFSLLSEDSSCCVAWEKLTFFDIEPFSLIVFDNDLLFRLTWDGVKKHLLQLTTKNSYIFSSVTLYPPPIQGEREKWFADYLNRNKLSDEETIWNFHTTTKKEDLQNGLLIQRPYSCHTVSVTQAVLDKTLEQIILRNCDILSKKEHKLSFKINGVARD